MELYCPLQYIATSELGPNEVGPLEEWGMSTFEDLETMKTVELENEIREWKKR